MEFHRRRKSLKSKTCFEGIKSFFSISLSVLSNACGKPQSRFSPISRKQSLIRNALSTAVQKRPLEAPAFLGERFASNLSRLPITPCPLGLFWTGGLMMPSVSILGSGLLNLRSRCPSPPFLLRPHRLVTFIADTHGIFCPRFVRVWPRLRTTCVFIMSAFLAIRATSDFFRSYREFWIINSLTRKILSLT